MSSEIILLVALAIPLITAVLVVATGRNPNLREAMSAGGGIALLLCTGNLVFAVAAGQRPSITLAEPLSGVPLVLTLEPLGAVFACLAAFLWIVTTIYSIGYMRGHGEQHQTRFYTCFAVSLFAVIGAASSGNLVTLFVFYELLTLATWPLVTHSGTPAARRAGRVYLGILLGSSILLLLLAVLWTHAIAGSTSFEDGGLLAPELIGHREPAGIGLSTAAATLLFTMFAFGIGKAALMPLHGWLPAAMVAPSPVSALLHAVAVVKTGVFALLKVAIYIFGLEGMRQTGCSIPVAYAAGLTMVLASLIALRRDNLKERLAYSTIGQLAYIVCGTASATTAGIVGAGLHMVTHAFGKITLFFAAGAIMVAAHRTRISAMIGLGHSMPFTFTALAVGALSIIGIPPLAGTWSKWWLGSGLVDADLLTLLGALLFSSLLSAVYLLPIASRAFMGSGTLPDNGAGSVAAPPAGHEAPWPCRVAMGITAAGCVVLLFLLGPLQELLEGIAQ